MLSIFSYNVNGIRSAITKGLLEWIDMAQPDILCLQEIKALESDIPLHLLADRGYHISIFSAEKKGYSGVAVFSKVKPIAVVSGGLNDLFDSEGRNLRIDYDHFTLINTYFPSGTTGDIRQDVKYQFLELYQSYIDSLRTTQPNLVVVGDFNIAHTPLDIHDPKGNQKSSGFLPDERKWMTQWFDSGMIDSFRHLHPDRTDIYSWWTYRAGARSKNKGWRIDYISISQSMLPYLTAADIHTDVHHSDHCPISVSLSI